VVNLTTQMNNCTPRLEAQTISAPQVKSCSADISNIETWACNNNLR